jgi:hypothetical protein
MVPVNAQSKVIYTNHVNKENKSTNSWRIIRIDVEIGALNAYGHNLASLRIALDQSEAD